VGALQSARLAYERITRNLSQSTLKVYLGYDNPSTPTKYVRKSDLHFVIDRPPAGDFGQGNAVVFQAPLGRTQNAAQYGNLPETLNSVGYYVTYGKEDVPAFLKDQVRNRFRLMQFQDVAEDMAVYTSSGKDWYANRLSGRTTVIANDVILLLCWPTVAPQDDPDGTLLTTNFRYDSRYPAAPAAQILTTNQQPPLVRVTMVALEDSAASRLPDSDSPPSVVTDCLAGLFTASNRADYQKDLAKLESRLTTAKLGYRVFDSVVPLRESQFSR
jgi:uncharacterized protein (TIGR02599 family)